MLSGVRWLSARALSPDLTLPPSTLPVGLALLRCLCQMPIFGSVCVCLCVCVCVVGACSEAYLITQVALACCVSIRDHMGSVYEDQHWLPGAAAPTYHNLGA